MDEVRRSQHALHQATRKEIYIVKRSPSTSSTKAIISIIMPLLVSLQSFQLQGEKVA